MFLGPVLVPTTGDSDYDYDDAGPSYIRPWYTVNLILVSFILISIYPLHPNVRPFSF